MASQRSWIFKLLSTATEVFPNKNALVKELCNVGQLLRLKQRCSSVPESFLIVSQNLHMFYIHSSTFSPSKGVPGSQMCSPLLFGEQSAVNKSAVNIYRMFWGETPLQLYQVRWLKTKRLPGALSSVLKYLQGVLKIKERQLPVRNR